MYFWMDSSGSNSLSRLPIYQRRIFEVIPTEIKVRWCPSQGINRCTSLHHINQYICDLTHLSVVSILRFLARIYLANNIWLLLHFSPLWHLLIIPLANHWFVTHPIINSCSVNEYSTTHDVSMHTSWPTSPTS